MATLKQKIATEDKVRQLLEAEKLPCPDRVEYGSTWIRMFWGEPRVALVVDIEEPTPESEDELLDYGASF